MFRKLITTSATWVPVPLRLALGIIFIAHGAQKVLGVFGGFDGKGGGLAEFAALPAPFGLRPAALWMGAAAVSELLGGLLVLAGLLTRLGAFLIACVMLVAMFGVHWGAFFMSNQPMPGIEFTVALLGASLALIISGGGRASFDHSLMQSRRWR